LTLLIDAGPLVGLAEAGEPNRERILDVMRAETAALVIPAPVTAEVDYLLGRHFGRPARRAFLRDLAAGRFTVGCLEGEDHARVADLDERYEDLDLGLADCALVVLAHRHRTTRILTFDERHFRAVMPLDGGAFTLLPSDA
jgi:predicted nucleic acid-binding protein